MADAVFGQKCDENVKNDLTKYMGDLGLGGKEFMAHLLELCELEASSKSVPELTQDLTELQVITTRMVSIYKNLCERVENLTSAKLQELEQSVSIRDREIERLRGEIEERDLRIENLSEASEKIVNEKDGLLTRVNELTDVNKKNLEYVETSKALVDEYKEKNDALLGKMTAAEEAVKERDTHLARIKELESDVASAKKDAATKDATIESLKESHTKALADAKEKYEFDVEKERLKLRKEHQDELGKVRTDANNMVTEHNDKVRSLLTEIEALQKRATIVAAIEQKKNATGDASTGHKRGPKGKDKAQVNGKDEVNVVNEGEKETGA